MRRKRPSRASLLRVVADDVVAGNILLRLHDAHGEIVVVEQRLAAGVAGQRVEGFLLALEIAGDGARRAAGIHALAARRSLGGVAQRRLRHQAAGIDGIERNVGADGGVDGGLQLRLVIHAVARHAAGEIDQRLLLVAASPAS